MAGHSRGAWHCFLTSHVVVGARARQGAVVPGARTSELGRCRQAPPLLLKPPWFLISSLSSLHIPAHNLNSTNYSQPGQHLLTPPGQPALLLYHSPRVPRHRHAHRVDLLAALRHPALLPFSLIVLQRAVAF